MRSRDLLTALATALRAIGGTGYRTEAGAAVQVGGTLSDRSAERDQIAVTMTRKDYRSLTRDGPADYASGTVSRLQAEWTFEIAAAAVALADESPGDRLLDLLDDVERALMLANVVRVGSSAFCIQIVSTDLTPRPDGADAEAAVVTIRLTGPQVWAAT